MSAFGEYPLPKFAAYIWLSGSELKLGLPPVEGHDKGHTVSIPLSKLCLSRDLTDKEAKDSSLALERSVRTLGFCILLDVLRERERLGRVPDLGRAGEPTQYNIEEVLRRVKRYNEHGREAATSLADLGLD